MRRHHPFRPRFHPQFHGPLPRAGRAIVELLVALLLLSVGVSACLSLAHASAAAAARVVQLAAARDLARELGERAQADACAAVSGSMSHARVLGQWRVVAAPPQRLLELDVSLPATWPSRSSPAPLRTRLAGWCP